MSGIGTRLLKISVGGSDYTAEVSKAVITSGEGDSDFVTFSDAASGGAREYRLEFTGVQDAETGSLWDQVFSNAGDTVACILQPYGNTAPSVTQPHFTFNATITEPDGDFIGGEANASTTARFTFDASWVCEAKPVKVTAQALTEMVDRAGFKVTGLNQVVRALVAMGVDVEDLKDAFSRIATEGADRAAAHSPKRSGRLARDIRGNRAKSKAVVTAGRKSIPYAGPINYGWPARNITASGFMQKADEEMRPRAVQILEDDINSKIRKRGMSR